MWCVGDPSDSSQAVPADTGIEAMTRTRTLFKNLAVPSTVLQTQEALDKDRADEIKEEWTQALAGSKRAGRTVVLHSGLKVEPSGGRLKTRPACSASRSR